MLRQLTGRPEPVMNAAGLAALLIVLVKAAVALAVAMNWVSWSDAQQTALIAFVVAVIDVAIVLLTMYYGGRLKVTPNEDPRDDQGRTLRPARTRNAQ